MVVRPWADSVKSAMSEPPAGRRRWFDRLPVRVFVAISGRRVRSMLMIGSQGWPLVFSRISLTRSTPNMFPSGAWASKIPSLKTISEPWSPSIRERLRVFEEAVGHDAQGHSGGVEGEHFAGVGGCPEHGAVAGAGPVERSIRAEESEKRGDKAGGFQVVGQPAVDAGEQPVRMRLKVAERAPACEPARRSSPAPNRGRRRQPGEWPAGRPSIAKDRNSLRRRRWP